MKKSVMFGLTLALLAAMAIPAMAEDARVGDLYTLNTCPVSGEELGGMGEPLVKVIEGREVRFCCGSCVKGFVNDPGKAEELDKKLIADQDAHYPSDKCVNSGADLNDSAVVFIAGNREFKTCCNKCAAKVKADPAAFIAKLDAEVIAAQKPGYTLDKDVVTGEALKEDAIDLVVANRLIRLNDAESVKAFEASPAKFIADVDAATK
jgi:Cu(I)/Ag(I) efflux system membrane fusion protein